MMAFTSAVEPLRAANLLSGKGLYDWRVITRDGRPLPSSNGIRLMPDASIETVANSLGPGSRLTSVVVCGFVSPSHFAKCYREQYDQVPEITRLGVPRPEPAGAGAVAVE